MKIPIKNNYPGPNPLLLISGDMNVFAEGYNACGVYGISGLAESSFRNRIYIGSTSDMRRRITSEHLPDLKNNNHCNKPLQNYFNKNGLENIVIWKIEDCNENDLLATEQKYLNYFGIAKNLDSWNILEAAGTTLGRKHSAETIKKMSIAQSNRSVETRAKISFAASSRSSEYCAKLSASKSKPFRLISPDGQIFEGVNIKDFAIKQGLCPSSLTAVASGKRRHYRGWRLVPKDPSQIKPFIFKVHRLSSPDGTVYTTDNISAFCRKHGLSQTCINSVALGKFEQCLGWKLAPN